MAAQGSFGGRLARFARFADLDDQVEACRRVFAGDTRWTVVRAGDPVLESNVTRRVDFALFMVEALENAARRPRRSRTPPANELFGSARPPSTAAGGKPLTA